MPEPVNIKRSQLPPNVSLDLESSKIHVLEETRIFLKSEFPNLNWEEGKRNRDGCHVFVAHFACSWQLCVEVLPIGCMATLSTGHQIISRSPNEQGKSLAEVIAVIKSDWREIASAMSFG